MSTFLTANWQNLIMANYEIDPELLLPYLPKDVELDYYNGKTYVSLVGFLFKDTKIFNMPIPILGTFEEINLRFYVIRKIGNEKRRGVVFINETVPTKMVAWVANKLYKEHYTATPTKHNWLFNENSKEIEYQWLNKGNWDCIKVIANIEKQKMENGSIEEFIFEHYFGYTKLNNNKTIEYKINHPRWDVNKVKEYSIKSNFGEFYGPNFQFLDSKKPQSVILAEGSAISVDWKRKRF